jgi:putative sterol carrier protein
VVGKRYRVFGVFSTPSAESARMVCTFESVRSSINVRGMGVKVASRDECRDTVHELVAKLQDVDQDKRKKHLPERTLELTLLDLDMSFCGTLQDGELINIQECEPEEKPNIRLTMDSDVLIDMHEGRLKFAHAWASGRLHLDAGVRDLLRLRSLM